MVDIKRKQNKLSHIYTSKSEYVLIEWLTEGYESEKYYTLHLCDTKAGLIAEVPLLELHVPFEHKKRYAPYFYSFMPLLVYGITTGRISLNKKRINFSLEKLDKLYKSFLTDYQNGVYDSTSIVAPELE